MKTTETPKHMMVLVSAHHADHPLCGHALQRPDDAGGEHVGEARADGELHGVHARVAHRR